jgi:hypothetical protein
LLVGVSLSQLPLTRAGGVVQRRTASSTSNDSKFASTPAAAASEDREPERKVVVKEDKEAKEPGAPDFKRTLTFWKLCGLTFASVAGGPYGFEEAVSACQGARSIPSSLDQTGPDEPDSPPSSVVCTSFALHAAKP